MTHVVIPARLNSTRLPRKMLLAETGKPLIVHTVEAALRAKFASQVTVVSEDAEIIEAVRSAFRSNRRVFASHEGPASSGTERIANYHVNSMGSDHNLIVNLQGDEPEFPGEVLDGLIKRAIDSDSPVTTLATQASPAEMHDSNVVKVVCDHYGKALYFSRSPIPYGDVGLRHLGVYVYRGGFLRQLPAMRETKYKGERLEQLQWLEMGCSIAVVTQRVDCTSIDTLEQYEQFVKRHANRS